MNKIINFIVIFVCSLMIIGCGQTGRLYLPNESPSNNTTDNNT